MHYKIVDTTVRRILMDRNVVKDMILFDILPEEEYLALDNDTVSISIDKKHVILQYKKETN